MAVRGIKWPGRANLIVSLVAIRKGSWSRPCSLDGQWVSCINSHFEGEEETANPIPLRINESNVFNGSNVLGKGFFLSENEASALINASPRNSEVILEVMNGKELNSIPDIAPQRWIVNFRERTLEEASVYVDVLAHVERNGRAEREAIPRTSSINRHYHDHWWQYGVLIASLYRALDRLSTCLVLAAPAKHLSVACVPADRVYTHALRVFASDRWDLFAVVQSTLHEVWARKYCGSLKQDLRYSPSKCFSTFAFPENFWQTADADLAGIGERYHEHRKALMHSLWLGLTKIYNLFHARDLSPEMVVKVSKKDADTAAAGYEGLLELRRLHVELDTAVRDAYGWQNLDLGHDFHEIETLPENDRVRYTISPAARKEVLKRLLAENHKRATAEAEAAIKTASSKPKTHVKKETKAAKSTGNLFQKKK